jgi:hypothetical protein
MKSAIGTLADVVSEEIEHLRKVVISGDLEQKIMQIQIKMEQVVCSVNKQENETSQLWFQLGIQRDEIGTLKAVEGKRIESVAAQWDDKLISYRNEMREIIEELRLKTQANT